MSVSVAAVPTKRLADLSTPSRAAGAARAMSVAIYLHDLAGGGVERQSLIIAEEFRRQGADVTLVLHRRRGELLQQVPQGLRIVDLNSARTLTDIPGLVRFLRAEKPDILLSNVDLNNIAALLAKGLGFSRTKVVICQHNPISQNFVTGEKWMYHHIALAYRILSPLMTRAVAVSAGVAAELESSAGLPAARILTIHNPVVGPDFEGRCAEAAYHPWFDRDAGSASQGEALQGEVPQGKVPQGPVFVTAGRLVPQKDHETMIRALALHRRRHDGRLIVLGDGPRREALQDLVMQLGLGDAVDFLGFRQNALPYFRQADAFLLSSRCEGFGNVIVEAMGCGTPVISSRCEFGPAEILEDGRYGVLVEPQNAAALAEAMDQAATLRERFPADMLRRRAGEFSYAACASRYMALFKALAPHRAWAASA
jgi:glycosyltransferase involved in cell wall biosynthesis